MDQFEIVHLTDVYTATVVLEYLETGHVFVVSGWMNERLVLNRHEDATMDRWLIARLAMAEVLLEADDLETT